MAGQNGGQGASTSLVADGFLAYYNYYDNQIYSIGMGPSQTKVSAPDLAATVGTPVVIRGTVMDISAGTQQNEQKADFPNGVPCASDASMSQWMEYVYMQKPMPTNFTGVTVSLNAVDPNGNLIHVGDATTNSNGVFDYTWTPPTITGNYAITATFAGTNSYWPSTAATGVTVQNTPASTAPTATAQSNLVNSSELMTYLAVGVIAIIIAIAIVGVLIIRKRP